MSSVKSKNTRPEIALRKAIWRKGLRYRVNFSKLPGKPDIVFTKAKIAVFCDGDYWHGHNWAIRGLKNLEEELSGYTEFWARKIRSNINRDKNVNELLERDGWIILRFWESDINHNVSYCADQVYKIYLLEREKHKKQ